MISVTYEPNESRLKVTGHAGYDLPGKDPICAAASMLTYTFATLCQSMDKAKWTTKPSRILLEEGNAVVQAYPRTNTCFVCRCKLDAIVEGYVVLAADYPGYVQVKIE